MLYPAQNGGVRQVNAALPHHGREISIAQFEAEVPTNAQDHDLLIKVATFEQLLDGYERWHQPIIANGPPCLHQNLGSGQLCAGAIFSSLLPIELYSHR